MKNYIVVIGDRLLNIKAGAFSYDQGAAFFWRESNCGGLGTLVACVRLFDYVCEIDGHSYTCQPEAVPQSDEI